MAELITHPLAAKRGWVCGQDYPEWGNNAYYLTTIQGSYLVDKETPWSAYRRLACRAAALVEHKKLDIAEMTNKFFDVLWKGWLIPSTPVMCNMGTDRGLPISCFSGVVGDDMYDIYRKNLEMAMLSKHGGGTAYDFSYVRPIGTLIKGGKNGTSDGIVPFIKSYDSTILASKQGKCYVEGTRVLTQRGFVDFRSVEPTDILAQVDDERNVSFTSKYELVEYDIEEDIYKFSGQTEQGLLDLQVTANHRMVIERRKDTSETIGGKRVRTSRYWPNKLTVVTAEQFKPHRDNRIHTAGVVSGERSITAEERFMIAYQADGEKTRITTKEGVSRIYFHFAKGRKVARLVGILNQCGFKYTISLHGDKTTRFIVDVPSRYVQTDFGWVDLSSIDSSWGNQFLHEVSKWDSYVTTRGSINYSSTIELNANIVLAIASISGRRAKLNTYAERTGNRNPIYTVFVRDTYSAIAGDAITKSTVTYKGKVYCAVVPDGKLIVESGGVVTICGNTRRGAVAIYLDAWHEEFKEFLRLRTGEGEIDRQCHTIHQGAKFDDKFMNLVKSKNGKERELWLDTLKARIKTGEPYVMFTDNANRDLPAHWAKHNLTIKHSNLCSEIFLPTDENHTLVCCLSSMNLYKWDEWKDTDAVETAIFFLDAVITEFLEKSANIKGIEDARRFAEKSRALGLGALGWHTLLKSKMIPFTGIQANSLTRIIFDKIRKQADAASKRLAQLFGEPEWMEGTGERNLTKLAIAPNRSSAQLAGGVSQSIEPDTANLFVDDTAKGMHLKVDIILQQLLASKGMDTREVWEQIEFDNGSVANIKDLTDEEKEVFLTAREINQLELVRQAGIRQTYLDQGQSINIFFYQDAPAKFINKVHMEAWEVGMKALYYLKSESKLKADKAKQRDLYSECISCQG